MVKGEKGSHKMIVLLVIIIAALAFLLLALYCRMKKAPGYATQEDMLLAVKKWQEGSLISAKESEMIKNILEFEDYQAKDVMVHRKNIVALSDDMTFLEAIEFSSCHQWSRYPVYHESIDNISGQIHIKEMLSLSFKKENHFKKINDIPGLLKNVDFIPETVGLYDLFREMQVKKRHMAIVIDEYGQTSGLVAMEDMIEEIFGNILDEHDHEETVIRKINQNSYLIDGLAAIEDVNEALEIEIDPEQFDTLNGFIIEHIEHIPSRHEKIQFEEMGYNFKVTDVDNKTVKSVIARKL